MAGRGTPSRHIESKRVGQKRLNADASAILFRQRIESASIAPTLNPDLLVKELAPNQKNQGSGGNRSEQSAEELMLPQFEPSAKRQDDQVLKLHFTYRELVENPDGPHFGWVDPPEIQGAEDSARNIRDALNHYAMNPAPVIVSTEKRQPREKSAYGAISTKALGRTLRQMNPSGVIDLAGAIARGIIIDANGKMRCPPGTPNANQFTDEFMTNCLAPPSLGRLRRMGQNLLARMTRLEMEGQILELQRTAAERVREAQKNYATPSEIADAAAERFSRVKDVVSRLAPGVSSENNEDYVTALLALRENGIGPELRNLFTGGAINPDGSPFEWDDALSTNENLKRFKEAVDSTYMEMLITQDYGQYAANMQMTGQQAISLEDYKARLSPQDLARLKKTSETLGERHQAALRGFMESFIDLSETDPDHLKFLKEIKSFAPGSDPEGFDAWIHTDGMLNSPGMGAGGIDDPTMLFNPYSITLLPIVSQIGNLDNNEYLVFRANNAAAADMQAAQKTSDIIARAIEDASFALKMSYAREISATLNKDDSDELSFIRLKASHVAYHEFGHVLQYAQASEKINKIVERDGEFTLYEMKNGRPKAVKTLKGPVTSWSNSDWGDAVSSLHRGYIGPNDDFPPVNAGVLEESMTHLLAGRYYQDEIKKALALPVGTDARIAAVKQAVNEATVEIYALKRMGVLRGEDIDKVTGWLDSPIDVQAKDREYIPPQTRDRGVTGSGWFSPALGGKERPTKNLQQAADSGRATAVAQDAIVPGLPTSGGDGGDAFNPLMPSSDVPQNPWSAMSKLILSDPDTGISDRSPSSRPSQRIEATARLVDSIFGLSEGEGAGKKIGEMKPEELDGRASLLESTIDRLLNLDKLSSDEQAELWAAAEDLINIITENNIRRRRSDRERRRAVARGIETRPGKYVSPTSGAESADDVARSMAQDGNDSADIEQIQFSNLLAIKQAIGDHFNKNDGSSSQGSPDFKPDPDGILDRAESIAIRRDRDLMESARRQAMELPDDGVTEVITGGGVAAGDRIPQSIANPIGDIISGLREFRDRSASQVDARPDSSPGADAPTPESVSRNIAREIDEVFIPAIERLNQSTMTDDIEVVVPITADPEVGSVAGDLSHHGIITAPLANSPEGIQSLSRSAGGSSDIQTHAKIIVRAGDRGALVTDEDGNVVGVTLPPGSVGVTEVDADGAAIGIIGRQQTPDESIQSMLDRLDSADIPDDLADDVERIRKMLSDRSVKSRASQGSSATRQRGVDPVPSRQRAGSAKTVAIKEALEATDSSPFNPPDREARVAQSREYMLRLTSLGSDLVSGARSPKNDGEFDIRERLQSMGISGDDIIGELSLALDSFFSSLDDKPRIKLSEKDVFGLVYPQPKVGSIFPSPVLNDGSPNPFVAARLVSDERHGFSADAPQALRPMEVAIVRSSDFSRGEEYLSSMEDQSVVRSLDFLSDTSEFTLYGSPSQADISIDVVLSPVSADRTVISSGGLHGPGVPSRLSESSPEELIAALLPFGDRDISDADSMMAILDIIEEARSGGDISKFFPGAEVDNPVSGLLTGGISRDDIFEVRIDIDILPDTMGELDSSDFGFDSDDDAIEFFIDRGLDDESAGKMLDYIKSPDTDFGPARSIRQSRIARSSKSLYGDLSDRIVFTNKDGIDLTDRQTFASAPYVDPEDSLDSILTKRAFVELDKSAKEIFKDLDKMAKDLAKKKARPRPSGRPLNPYEPPDEPMVYMGSRSRSVGRIARGGSVMTRIARSERARNLMRRAGIDDENIEMVAFLGELATAFSVAGPPGMAAVLARSAGRSGFDVAIRKAVEKGLIDPNIARKLISAADKVAPDGLPGRFEEIIGDGLNRVDTESVQEKARDISEAAREALSSSELFDRASESARKLRDRISTGRNRGKRQSEMYEIDGPYDTSSSMTPSGLSPDDPFGELDDPYPTPALPSPIYDDPFSGPYDLPDDVTPSPLPGDDPFGEIDDPYPIAAPSSGPYDDPFSDPFSLPGDEEIISEPTEKRKFWQRRRGQEQAQTNESEESFEYLLDDPYDFGSSGPYSTSGGMRSRSQRNFDDGRVVQGRDGRYLMEKQKVKELKDGGRIVFPNNGDYEVWETESGRIVFISNNLDGVENEAQRDFARQNGLVDIVIFDEEGSIQYKKQNGINSNTSTTPEFSDTAGSRSRSVGLAAGSKSADSLSEKLDTDDGRKFVWESGSSYYEAKNDIAHSLRESLQGTDGRTSDGETLDDVISEGDIYYSLDSIAEIITSSSLDESDKESYLERVELARALDRLGNLAYSSYPEEDPFEDKGPRSSEDLKDELQEILSSVPESQADQLSSILNSTEEKISSQKKQQELERQAEETKRNAKLQAEKELFDSLSRIDSVPRKIRIDREFPESGTAKTIKPSVDWKEIEPQDGIVRRADEMERGIVSSIAMASDLTEDGRADDLAEVLLTDKLLEIVDSLNDRQLQNREGAEAVAELIRSRGYDAPAARLSHDEIDRLVHMSSYTPISRGGAKVPQQSHMDNDTFFVGEGVDGAGVYFAIEGGNRSHDFPIAHGAATYAKDSEGNPGYVIRGVVSPVAKLGSPGPMHTRVQDYRDALKTNPDNPISDMSGGNELLEMRQRLLSSGSERDAKMVEVLDTLLIKGDDGENKNSSAVAAILMGYDGMISANSSDNRVIVLNRSAFPVATTPLSGEEWLEMSSYEKLRDRSIATARRDGILTDASSYEEQRAYIDRRQQEILDEMLEAKKRIEEASDD